MFCNIGERSLNFFSTMTPRTPRKKEKGTFLCIPQNVNSFFKSSQDVV